MLSLCASTVLEFYVMAPEATPEDWDAFERVWVLQSNEIQFITLAQLFFTRQSVNVQRLLALRVPQDLVITTGFMEYIQRQPVFTNIDDLDTAMFTFGSERVFRCHLTAPLRLEAVLASYLHPKFYQVGPTEYTDALGYDSYMLMEDEYTWIFRESPHLELQRKWLSYPRSKELVYVACVPDEEPTYSLISLAHTLALFERCGMSHVNERDITQDLYNEMAYVAKHATVAVFERFVLCSTSHSLYYATSFETAQLAIKHCGPIITVDESRLELFQLAVALAGSNQRVVAGVF